MADRILATTATLLTLAVVALMIVLLLGSLVHRSGSLDDLPGDKIKEAVDAATER